MKYVFFTTILAVCRLVFAPLNVSATQTVSLSWDPSPAGSIAEYHLYYGTESGFYTSMISSGTSNQTLVSGLLEGVAYYFAAAAMDVSGVESDLSNEVSYSVPGLAPPGPVFSIETTSLGQGVALSWVASPSPEVVGYEVSYGTQSGIYTNGLSVTGSNQAIIDNLQKGVTYFFAVRAYDAANAKSAYTPEVSYTVSGISPPGSIISIQQVLPEEVINVKWAPSLSQDAVGYILYYGPDAGYSYNQMYVDATNVATVYGLANGVKYVFYVTAYDSTGLESAPSSMTTYTVPALDPPAAITSITPSNAAVTLTWLPSQSLAANGYFVYYGPYPGYYLGAIYVDGTNTATVYGLENGQTYYFTVTTIDYNGQESGFSSEMSCTLPVVAAPGPILTLQSLDVPGFQNAYAITSSGPLPATWVIEASADLQNWRPLTSGTDSALNVAVVASAKPKLFFRLNSQYPDHVLQAQTAPINVFPNSLVISTVDPVWGGWTVESSEDLLHWQTFTGGADSHVNVAVIYAENPALFFRLSGQ